VPALIYHMPANFPPVPTRARTLSGMGTPDVLGTYGTFSYYTDDLYSATGPVNGGRVYPVKVEDFIVRASLYGPYNTFRKGEPESSLPFRVALDPQSAVADIRIEGHEFVLREGELSPWITLRFDLLPHLAGVSGICRFYLKQVRPTFQLYVTPVNMDPSDPALPISTPGEYARELREELGPFYTQGIAEDTKALSGGYLNDAEYLAQARTVLDEQLRAYARELARFRSGLFFFYFSSLDLNSHMFWRALDPQHPGYTPEIGEKYGAVLESLYRQMDQVLGEALAKAGDDAIVLVLSDHGFAPYRRSFNLNAWLRDRGYLVLLAGATTGGDSFQGVDWTRTRAYGLGLNGLYLNLRGRERQGIVEPGRAADALRQELARALLEVRDPADGQPVITRVDIASQAYSSHYAAEAPDLLIGYNRGYRAGWGTVLGGVPAAVMEDNLDPWSGDHCMDFRQVPGVLLSNRHIALDAPALTDVAPTVLALYGIAQPREMKGQTLLGSAPDEGADAAPH
jgi:predicted AlkP superfamily phosphohydrolase/phosphomutase